MANGNGTPPTWLGEFIKIVIGVALAVFGWGFASWSQAVGNLTNEVQGLIDRVQRNEQRLERFEEKHLGYDRRLDRLEVEPRETRR